MDRFDIWGGICIAVGCGFLATALRIFLARKRFLACAEAATGTVIEARTRGVGRNVESVPVFEFRTASGQVQRAESWMGSGFQGFETGQSIHVRYDPADPAKAEVDTFAVMWGLALLRAGYALIFLILGSVALIFG